MNRVIGAPLLAPAVQDTVAVRDSWVMAVTAAGGSGRSRTVSRMRPSTFRLASLVASPNVYRTVIWPWNPTAGVTTI